MNEVKTVNDIKRYSINLLWLNKEKNAGQKYIHTSGEVDGLTKSLLRPALKWAAANKEGTVKIWFDSELHTPEAIQNTKDVLTALCVEEGRNNIELHDIREISFVKKNSSFFSEGMPLYFKIDFLKLIINLHSLESDGDDASIFSDLEVGDKRADKGRMDKSELFDSDTMKKSESAGMLVTKGMAYENQFLQVIKNDQIMSALKHTINSCLVRAAETLKNHCDVDHLKKLYAIPFFATLYDVARHYSGEIKVCEGFIKKNDSKEWVKYDAKIHDYLVLGNYFDPYRQTHVIEQDGKFTYASKVTKVPSTDDLDAKDYSRKVDVRHGNSHHDTFKIEKPLDLEYKYWDSAEDSPIYHDPVSFEHSHG